MKVHETSYYPVIGAVECYTEDESKEDKRQRAIDDRIDYREEYGEDDAW